MYVFQAMITFNPTMKKLQKHLQRQTLFQRFLFHLTFTKQAYMSLFIPKTYVQLRNFALAEKRIKIHGMKIV